MCCLLFELVAHGRLNRSCNELSFYYQAAQSVNENLLSRGYTSDFLLVMVIQFFLEIVMSLARGGGHDFVAKS